MTRNPVPAFTLLLLLAVGSRVDAQCPAPESYGSLAPILHGTYGPYDIRSNGPDSSTACLGNGPGTPCADHHVYVPGGTSPQPPTVVFLPGSGMEPDKHDLVLQMAAYAGYRAIGLSYDNVGSVSSLCGTPSCDDDCAENIHIERVTGQDVSPASSTVGGDAILPRLYALLVELHTEDMLDGTNDLHWDALYEPAPPMASSLDMSTIHWERIFIMGFSQGGGHAMFLAKRWPVGAAMVLDSNGESCDDEGLLRPEDWVTDPFNASSGRPHYGVGHARGESPPLVVQAMWPALGFGEIPGENLDAGSFAWPPSSASYTDQLPVFSCTEHSTMAKDGCMPTSATSTVAADTPDAAHLFEPYLLRLCAACVAPGCTTQPASLPGLHAVWSLGAALALLVCGTAGVRTCRRK